MIILSQKDVNLLAKMQKIWKQDLFDHNGY